MPTFAVRPPVLRLRPGAVVETRTFSRPGDYYEKAGGPWPGEVGPFYIEGATPDDTLVVRIVRLRWLGHTLHAEADILIDPQMSDARAHQLAHDAEAHLISHLPRITDATIHARPTQVHP